MAQFLRGILHPDGEIPLFNDSVLGGARAPAELLAMAELCVVAWASRPLSRERPAPAGTARAGCPRPSGRDAYATSFSSTHCAVVEGESRVSLFPDTGYAVIKSPESRSTLIFDCGALGPDYQPGHGHCDVLSYELSLHGQRVVVDTGVNTYEPGPERSYERSTTAHNTVRIDGEEQAEIWASFRVGRRPRVGRIRGGSDGALPFVAGEHDGYRRLGVVHTRTIVLLRPDTWIVADLLGGSGTHRVESFLHFHPTVCVEALGGLIGHIAGLSIRGWKVEFADQSYLLAAYGAGQFDLRQSWYSERFGGRQSSTALRWAWQGILPAGMISVFAPMGSSLPHIAVDWSEKLIEIDGREIPLC